MENKRPYQPTKRPLHEQKQEENATKPVTRPFQGFGAWLRQQRRWRNQSQKELAQLLGYSVDLVRRIEDGTRRATPDFQRHLAKIWGLDVDTLPPADIPLLFLGEMPPPLTTLIGRDAELQAARKFLLDKDTRLLTIVGPPGVGKTHLAKEAARQVAQHFGDGVYFVDLTAVHKPTLIVSEILRALAIKNGDGQPPLVRLKEFLRYKEVLLLLDNFEHLLDGVGLVVDLLAIQPPRLKICVTSRVPLRIRGEQLLPVSPLTFPDLKHLSAETSMAEYTAVTLYLKRAQAANPSFQLTAENGPAVAELCARLDGLPLAIELTAVHSNVLSPQNLLERLNHDGLAFIRHDGPAPARHQQTMLRTIEWSYNLLAGDEKRLLACLSVFAGPFTPLEVQEICLSPEVRPSTTLNLLTSLANNSLLRRIQKANGELAFALLDTIQAFGLAQLQLNGEEAATRQRHIACYQALVERAGPELRGPRQVEWLDRLEAAHTNIQAAFTRLIAVGEVETAARICSSLARYWYARGAGEGVDWMHHLLASTTLSPQSRAELQVWATTLLWQQGDYVQARQMAESALAYYQMVEDEANIAQAFGALGLVALYQANLPEAEKYLRCALNGMQAPSDRADVQSLLCLTSVNRQAFAEAQQLVEQAMNLYRENEDVLGQAIAYGFDGVIALFTQDLGRATASLERCVHFYEEVGFIWGIASTNVVLGFTLLRQSNISQAKMAFMDSLFLSWRHLADRGPFVFALEGFAGIALLNGEPQKTVKLLAAVANMRHNFLAFMQPIGLDIHEMIVKGAQAMLDEATFAEAWDEGHTMTPADAMAYALRLP